MLQLASPTTEVGRSPSASTQSTKEVLEGRRCPAEQQAQKLQLLDARDDARCGASTPGRLCAVQMPPTLDQRATVLLPLDIGSRWPTATRVVLAVRQEMHAPGTPRDVTEIDL